MHPRKAVAHMLLAMALTPGGLYPAASDTIERSTRKESTHPVLSLEGVWAFQSLKNLRTGKTMTGSTGYLIFSKHYFAVVITANQRKKLAPDQALSTLGKDELLDLLQISAGTGSYEITGTTLVVKTLAHLRPEAVGTEIREEIKLKGDIMSLTYPGLVTTSFYNKGDLIESTFKRVE